MNDVMDALGPLASTLVGGGVAAIIMKMAVTKWFKSIEKDSETLREVDKTLAVVEVAERWDGTALEWNYWLDFTG